VVGTFAQIGPRLVRSRSVSSQGEDRHRKVDSRLFGQMGRVSILAAAHQRLTRVQAAIFLRRVPEQRNRRLFEEFGGRARRRRNFPLQQDQPIPPIGV
jgi:hypothetical protein